VPVDPSQLILVALIVAGGLVASVVATAAEIALLSQLTPSRIRMHENDPVGALLAERDRLTLSLRAFSLGARICVAAALAAALSRWMPQAPRLGFALGGLLGLMLSVIVLELVPKSLPEESTHAASLFLAPFAWIIVALMKPLAAVFAPLNRRLGGGAEGDPDEAEAQAAEIELRTALRLGEIEGVIDEDTRDIIEGIFLFGDRVAADIMTPRAELSALPRTELASPDLEERLKRSARSRVIVYDRNIDHVVGVLDRRRLLLNPGQPVESFVAQPLFVADSRKLIDLLTDMKRSRTYFAVVLDRYGATAGVVALQDLLDEIVGEMEEDAMRGEEVRPLRDGAWLLSGRLEIERLNQRLQTDLPEEPPCTVSGFIMARMGGRLPAIGDCVEEGPARLTVTRMGARRVAQARLELAGRAEPAGGPA